MKDKLSKVKNLVKKYGLTGTIKKMTGYIYSNYIVRISMKEKIYVALNKKEIRKRLKRMLEREDYDRIVVWRSSFGWDVPLYQRPQHIFTNFAKQRTLVLYEVTRFTDDVKRIKRQSENLYLVNFMNKAFANYIFEAIEQQEKPRYVQFYSTDWTLTKGQIEERAGRAVRNMVSEPARVNSEPVTVWRPLARRAGFYASTRSCPQGQGEARWYHESAALSSLSGQNRQDGSVFRCNAKRKGRLPL